MKGSLKIVFLPVFLFFQTSVFAQQAADEWIKVYFNMPSDTSVIKYGAAGNPSVDLISTLTDLVDNAKYSVDLSIYDLENMRVGNALADAKKRGVRVRVVTDNFNRTDGGELDEKMWARLAEAGIYSIDDDGDVYRPDGTIDDNRLVNAGADMHHKFAVIDYNPASPGDAFVWAGSTNMTYTGQHNTNNTMVIKHHEIARVFTEEFEQMWGGSGDIPNPGKARFHKDKQNVSRNIFDVNGTKVEIYFAPVNRDRTKPSISDRVVEIIEKETDHDIKFLSFAITPAIDISQAMWFAPENTNITLQGVIDRGFYSRYRNAGDIWGSSEATAGNRLILPAEELRKMHQKFILIDAENPDTNDVAIVITGSYNFSANAELNNDENLFIIYSNEIANQYYQNFSGAMARAQGTAPIPAPYIRPAEWYRVHKIRDGATFEVEVDPGFGYPVRLLGVSVPGSYAGPDSTFYFAEEADYFLRTTLEGRQVKIIGHDGGAPNAHNNSFYGYVTVKTPAGELSLNKLMLENGMGTVNGNFEQHPDSVAAFKKYARLAGENGEGLWRYPDKIWTKIPVKPTVAELAVEYPININTADQKMLEMLPGIGPAYAKRIIEYREANKGFTSVSELINVKGIGEKRLEAIRALVSVN